MKKQLEGMREALLERLGHLALKDRPLFNLLLARHFRMRRLWRRLDALERAIKG